MKFFYVYVLFIQTKSASVREYKTSYKRTNKVKLNMTTITKSICVLCGEIREGSWNNRHSNTFYVLQNTGKFYFRCDGITADANDICNRCFQNIRGVDAAKVKGKKVYDNFFRTKRTKEERRQFYMN